MSSKVEKLETNKVKIEITVLAKDFDEAVDKAMALAREKLMLQLQDDEKILYEKKLKTTQNNSTIVVTVFFKVYENITAYEEIQEQNNKEEDKG